MPIANCILAPDVEFDGSAPLVQWWSEAAGVTGEHMTVNVLRAERQLGQRYAAMVWLYVPSIWTPAARERLQSGLADIFVRALDCPVADVHVITQTVLSGDVVEDGQRLTWP